MRELAEKALEMRGMQRSEIVDYLIGISLENIDNCRFMGQDWEAELSPEKIISLGVIKIPSNTVIFRGNIETLEQVISAFRLRFLSAGG